MFACIGVQLFKVSWSNAIIEAIIFWCLIYKLLSFTFKVKGLFIPNHTTDLWSINVISCKMFHQTFLCFNTLSLFHFQIFMVFKGFANDLSDAFDLTFYSVTSFNNKQVNCGVKYCVFFFSPGKVLPLFRWSEVEWRRMQVSVWINTECTIRAHVIEGDLRVLCLTTSSCTQTLHLSVK